MKISENELDILLKDFKFDENRFNQAWSKIDKEESNTSAIYDPFLHIEKTKYLKEALNVFRQKYQDK